MPEKKVQKRAQRDKAQGKAPSTQAGEFVREEIHHVREGKHGARSAKQAIAIGLSKARRSGVELPAPKPGKTSAKTRKSAARDTAVGHAARRRAPSKRRARASMRALKREPHSTASTKALSKQTRSAAKKRTPAERSRAAKKAARTRAAEAAF
jgi:hypothetical protein